MKDNKENVNEDKNKEKNKEDKDDKSRRTNC